MMKLINMTVSSHDTSLQQLIWDAYNYLLYSGTCLKQPPPGPNLLAALDRWSFYAGSTECKRVI